MTEPIVQSEEFAHSDLEAFKQRVQFSLLGASRGVDGILADWGDLFSTLSSETKEKKPEFDDSMTLQSGEAERVLDWSVRGAAVELRIFVSGAGHRRAQQRLLSQASNTTRMDIPYRAGPGGLGDFSVRSLDDPASAVIWVYRNVCVQVRDFEGQDVEPIARAVQKFLEAHRVARIAEHLPRVDRVDVSARTIHVGEEVRIAVALTPGARAEAVMTSISESSEGLLQRESSGSPLSAVFRGSGPGTARVDISVVDRKTLLSPPLSVTVEVLPGPG